MSAEADARPEKEFGNAFFQAQMKHTYAQVSPQAVILCLFVIAVVFIPVGAATIIATDAVFEWSDRYDHLNRCTHSNHGSAETHPLGNSTVASGCFTNVGFRLDQTLVPPIYIYYRMKGFNQNYRLYAKSFNEAQLSDRDYGLSDLDDCDPKKTPTDGTITIGTETKALNTIPYAPCGQVPWSMFNDTISLFRVPDEATAAAISQDTPVLPSGVTPICVGDAFSRSTNKPTVATGCVKEGIAFSQDVESRFKANPSSSASAWTGNGYTGVTDNAFFNEGYYNNEAGHRIPLIPDEDFMVWSRIAPLADFRKPYRKITVGLQRGLYLWRILERFDTTSLGAEKYAVLATTAWIGTKNPTLGALYLTMGSISLVLAFGFVGMYIARSKE
uniref:ALA-interacting subunit n=1 Tax=Neobodo designis TaxID=312471 RepID=A0A7S1W254_NEODS